MAMGRVLAWGVLLAGAAQLLVQFPALRRTGLLGGRPKRKERPAFGASVARRVAEPLEDLAVELAPIGQQPPARRTVQTRQALRRGRQQRPHHRPRAADLRCAG